MSSKPFVNLNFLISPSEDEEGRYVAHCLELDTVAVADSIDGSIELLKELIEDLFAAAASDGSLDQVFKPAPRRFWRQLGGAKSYTPPKSVKKRRIRSKPPINNVGYALAGTAG